METKEYTGYYNDIKAEEPLGDEGILTGSYGDLHYKRCQDGLAVIDSSFLGSGFVCIPTSVNIGFPAFINGIPVTEIHQSLSLSSTYPIAIEAPELKRAYLRISKASFNDQVEKTGDSFRALIMFMLRDQENVNQKEKFTEISLHFYKPGNEIDYCEIQCARRCVLDEVAARHLVVKAPTVVLKDSAYNKLEQAEFSGKVYPFVYYDWDGPYANIDYFSGNKNLRLVDGSLRGDDCWRFTGCSSLEKIHLANGIQKILPHSFENCTALTDLYIPDSVTEIGAYAFSGCKNLRTIHLPSSLRQISKGLFFGCESLTKCFLSDDIESIEDDAFRGCASLRKPWIPKNIKTISETAFDNPDWRRY